MRPRKSGSNGGRLGETPGAYPLRVQVRSRALKGRHRLFGRLGSAALDRPGRPESVRLSQTVNSS